MLSIEFYNSFYYNESKLNSLHFFLVLSDKIDEYPLMPVIQLGEII